MPGTTSLTVTNEQLTANAFHYLNTIRNVKNRPYPAVDRVLKDAEKVEGGERLIVSYEVDDHSRPTRMVTGYEQWDDFAQTTFKPGHESWAYVVQPILIAERDKILNRGKGKQIDIAKRRTKNVDEHMRRQFNQVLFKGPAASGTWTGVPGFEDFLGWNGADNSTHFIEAAASGTNTVHNIARGSYPATSHPQLHNEFGDALDAAGTNLLNLLTLINLKLRKKGGQLDPSAGVWWSSVNAMSHLKRLLRPLEQYVSGNQLDDGARMAMVYDGVEIIPEDLPDAGLSTAANPWSMLYINHKEGCKFVGQTGYIMSMDPFESISGSKVQAALMHLFGQNTNPYNGLNAVINNAETY
jgi:hypothetical protein